MRGQEDRRQVCYGHEVWGVRQGRDMSSRFGEAFKYTINVRHSMTWHAKEWHAVMQHASTLDGQIWAGPYTLVANLCAPCTIGSTRADLAYLTLPVGCLFEIMTSVQWLMQIRVMAATPHTVLQQP